MINTEYAIFSDLLVIELASVLAGPSVGMFFAELGARVIKIENPRSGGDVTRSWRSKGEDEKMGQSAYYSSINWGKQVIMMDLTESDQYASLLDLIKKADVVISNYLPRVATKLSVDYESLRRVNNRLIYANISGYGPGSDRPAFDVILQAESGFMSMNGDPNGLPTKMPVALIDILAAHHLKQGVLVALLQRQIKGEGCRVDVSLQEAAIASLANQATNFLMNDQIPTRLGSKHPNIAPYGDLFKTKDDRWIVTAIGTNTQFQQFCQLIQADDLLSDERFKDNSHRVLHRNELCDRIQSCIFKLERSTLVNLAHQKGIPITAIHDLSEVFSAEKAKSMILTDTVNGQTTKCVTTKIFTIS